MSTYSYREFDVDSERLYAHLLNLRTVETPEELLDRFEYLFIHGTDYPDPSLQAALDRIVSCRWADQMFGNILNRCCYILVNYWWMQRDGWMDCGSQWATVELVDRLSAAAKQSAHSSANWRLRELLTQFVNTEQYVVLERRARAAENASAKTNDDLIGNLINRYPYLYPYCLLDWDSTEMGQQAVKHQQQRREQQFEHDLFKYINALRRGKGDALATIDAANPTLLEAEQLQAAVRQFSGKAEGSRTYKESAQQFMLEVRHAPSQKALKKQLSHYLTSAIAHSNHPNYGSHHFNQWLDQHLDNILPQQDHVHPNAPLLVQTCSQLLDCFIANPKQSDHFMFLDLISNLGATFTVGLLLKIVLLFRSMPANLEGLRSHLAKQLSTIFKFYETKVIGSSNQWFVECLDNWLIASTIHFGKKEASIWAPMV